MNNWLILFGIYLSFFIACTESGVVETRNADDVVVEKYEVNKEMQKHGFYKRYYPEGTIQEETEYREGVEQGTKVFYDQEGNILSEAEIVEGQYHGSFKEYHPSGQIKQDGVYVDNKMDSIWTFYYPSGKKKEEVTFKDNREHGPFTEWYENGNLKAEGTYFEGDNEHGELKLYDTTGKMVRIMQCNKGVCQTTWELESS